MFDVYVTRATVALRVELQVVSRPARNPAITGETKVMTAAPRT